MNLGDFYDAEVLPRLTVDAVYAEVRWTHRKGRHWRGPCPLHGGRNPSFSVDTESLRWKCWSKCGTSGSALDYLNRGAKVKGRAFKEAVARAAELAGVAMPDGTRAAPPRARPPAPVRTKPEPPKRPPADELAELWGQAAPVTEDLEVLGWLDKRGLDHWEVNLRGLARVLPPNGNLPQWAQFKGRPWNVQGYRLVVPVYGATGRMESVRVRSVLTELPKSKPKALPPTGFTVKGLAMADELGRAVLETGAFPSWWGGDVPEVRIAEGEPDFFTETLLWADNDPAAPAVLGMVSGSWTEELAARIPDGARVTLAVHNDDKGDGYAEEVRRTLAGRCELFRTPYVETDGEPKP